MIGEDEAVLCAVWSFKYNTPVGITVLCTYVRTLASGTLWIGFLVPDVVLTNIDPVARPVGSLN